MVKIYNSYIQPPCGNLSKSTQRKYPRTVRSNTPEVRWVRH